VGHVDVNGISFDLPDGRPLLDEVAFRVGEGAKAALIGPNGTGKTTLLRIIAGDLEARAGAVTRSGGLGVMRQFIGHGRRRRPRCATCWSRWHHPGSARPQPGWTPPSSR
jgi:ATPase subunit of ABC transporter with duplicated ATPase domains